MKFLQLLTGIVIQMIDDRMSPATAKTILQGTADPLNSAFHLTYNMVIFVFHMVIRTDICWFFFCHSKTTVRAGG